ncbi:MAG: hypothetical protein ACLTYW_05990 [Collinsella sp.]
MCARGEPRLGHQGVHGPYQGAAADECERAEQLLGAAFAFDDADTFDLVEVFAGRLCARAGAEPLVAAAGPQRGALALRCGLLS